jgi:hypothetical protein
MTNKAELTYQEIKELLQEELDNLEENDYKELSFEDD